MTMPTRAAAVVAAASLALTPTAAIAAKAHHHHHPSARATCRALRRQMGVAKFDATFGTGPKHRRAMARCVALHRIAKKSPRER